MTHCLWEHYNSKFLTIYYNYSIIIKYYEMRVLVVAINSFESFGNTLLVKIFQLF